MTGHDDGQPVGGTGLADLARLPWDAEASGDLTVGGGRTDWNFAQGIPYIAFEVRSLQVEHEVGVMLGMVDQSRKPADRFGQRRSILDEMDARKACLELGQACIERHAGEPTRGQG